MDWEVVGHSSVPEAYMRFMSGEVDTLTAADVAAVLGFCKNASEYAAVDLEDDFETKVVSVIAREALNMNAEELSVSLSSMGFLSIEPGEAKGPLRSAIRREVDGMNAKQVALTWWGSAAVSMDAVGDLVGAVV